MCVWVGGGGGLPMVVPLSAPCEVGRWLGLAFWSARRSDVRNERARDRGLRCRGSVPSAFTSPTVGRTNQACDPRGMSASCPPHADVSVLYYAGPGLAHLVSACHGSSPPLTRGVRGRGRTVHDAMLRLVGRRTTAGDWLGFGRGALGSVVALVSGHVGPSSFSRRFSVSSGRLGLYKHGPNDGAEKRTACIVC